MKKSWTAFIVVLALAFVGARPATAGGFCGLFDGDGNCCDEACCCESGCCDSGCCSSGGCDGASGCGSIFDGLKDFAGEGCGSCCSFIKKSDHCFDDFISPMINPIFFEDPRTLTEIRPIFMHHRLPDSVGTLGIPGGSLQVYAAQIRVALTERLSLIAVKDGYIVTQMDGGPLDSLLNDGWAAVTAGLKYNLYRNTNTGTLLSTGFTYEIPMGSRRSLQDVADGEFHTFVSGGQRLFDGNAHLLSTFGWRQPVDTGAQVTAVHWSNHADVRLTSWLYAVTEVAWWHWTDSAEDGIDVGFAGQDLLDFGASDVEGNDLVSQSVGFRIKPAANLELGAIYEFPLSTKKDILQDRWTFDMIVRY